MKISVIGQGYVGLSLAVGATSVGHEVIGIDKNKILISQLTSGQTYVPGIDQKILTSFVKSGKYLPTTEFKKLESAEVIIIAVPTPLDQNRKPDLSYIRAACLKIAIHASEKTLIINESTSYPGTLRNFIKPEIESNSKIEFLYASAPERIDPGNQNWDLFNTPRVISGLTNEATKLTSEIYKTFCSKVYEVSTPEVAEASKLFENTFRQINIALANEFAVLSNSIGFSAHEAILAASTKPFGFMPFFPSIGVGGHCIPVDPSYLSYAADLAGSKAKFIDLANTTNLSMAKYTVNRINKFLNGKLQGKLVQVAGISYKTDIPDLRESPALLLIDELKSQGAKVFWCDPEVGEYEGSKSSQLDPNIDLGLIVTPHKKIDFTIWKNAGTNVIDLSANSVNYGWPKFF